MAQVYVPYERQYYIVFKPSIHKPWWGVFLHADFRHCFLITQSGKSKCVVIDPTNGGTGLYIKNMTAEELANSFSKYHVISFMAHEKNMSKPRAKFFRTCVGTCKDFLGITDWRIITPYQLYKYIQGVKL